MNTFAVDDRIRHRAFGEGTITRIQTAGIGHQMVVAFDKHGERTFLIEFAEKNIEKIEGKTS
jgi:hypothetical protein